MSEAAASPLFEVRQLTVDDLMGFVPQASQRLQLGCDMQFSEEEARELVEQDDAWACLSRGRLIACLGIREMFPGAQGVGWAFLGEGIGAAHLALTRFARSRIMGSRLPRIELIAISDDAEPMIADDPVLATDGPALLTRLARSSCECIWAAMIGFSPKHVLRKFGQMNQTHVLFERIS